MSPGGLPAGAPAPVAFKVSGGSDTEEETMKRIEFGNGTKATGSGRADEGRRAAAVARPAGDGAPEQARPREDFRTEIVFILDASGSMGGLEDDTVGGFNSMLDENRDEPGEAVVSTILFSDGSRVLHDRIDIREVPALTRAQYRCRGCTALLDAVAGPSSTRTSCSASSRRATAPTACCSRSRPTAWRTRAGATPTPR